MSYPSMPDIISSVKVSQLIKDPILTGFSVQVAKSGLPVMYVGGFSMVFPMTKQTEKWAMKVWHTEIKYVKERYKEVSNYLVNKNTDYFANFTYVEKGLLVNGQVLGISRMRWVEGSLLKDFIKENLKNKNKLIEFTDNLLALIIELHKQLISHGDLQHGNIIIQKNGDIKLVDYDSICIPSLEGRHEFVTGLKGYQHPSRFTIYKCSIKADYFSELIIYLSVLAIVENPELWNKYQVNDTEVLLFSQDDFHNFKQSTIKKDLANLSPKIKWLTSILESYLEKSDFRTLQPFYSYIDIPPQPPPKPPLLPQPEPSPQPKSISKVGLSLILIIITLCVGLFYIYQAVTKNPDNGKSTKVEFEDNYPKWLSNMNSKFINIYSHIDKSKLNNEQKMNIESFQIQLDGLRDGPISEELKQEIENTIIELKTYPKL